MSTMWVILRSTIHEILDSRKAVILIMTVLGSFLANAGGIIFAHFGAKLGLSPELAAKIPVGAFYLSFALVSLAVTYVHAQGKVDAVTAGTVAPTVGSPGFKAALEGLAVESLKAALDQHLPGAILNAIKAATAPPVPAPPTPKPAG